MASIFESALKAVRGKGLGNIVREIKEGGFLRCLPDGNLLQVDDPLSSLLAELITQWVEYAKKDRYNASQVPPEWHGWLHNITDPTGDELLMLRPKRYGVAHRENFSGEGEEYIYHSKGHALNPDQKDWTRYQPWQPAEKS